MKKEILNLGKTLSRKELKTVYGGNNPITATCDDGSWIAAPLNQNYGTDWTCVSGVGCISPDGSQEWLCDINVEGFEDPTPPCCVMD